MDEETYLKERLNDQLDWYDQKSLTNQTWFKRLRMMELISAALIPFIAGMSGSIGYSEWLIGFLGLLIAACVGASSVNKYQENWIQYRSTSETLKHEKYLFLCKTSPYDNTNSFKLLVSRVEGIISKENSGWSSYINKDDAGTNNETH